MVLEHDMLIRTFGHTYVRIGARPPADGQRHEQILSDAEPLGPQVSEASHPPPHRVTPVPWVAFTVAVPWQSPPFGSGTEPSQFLHVNV